jgi:threonine dehydratase
VAYGIHTLGGSGIVFVPEQVSAEQERSIASYGVRVERRGLDCLETETAARRYAEENQLTYVSPYNDEDVIAGQGTIAVEVVRQLDTFDTIFVALGGGGLVAGIGSYLKVALPTAQVVACSPVNSPVMHHAIEAGRVVEVPMSETLSHSTAGGIEQNSITLGLCRHAVDQRVLVSEERICEAMRSFIDDERMLIEGAAALSVAACVQEAKRFAGQRVVILICGANVTRQQLHQVLPPR